MFAKLVQITRFARVYGVEITIVKLGCMCNGQVTWLIFRDMVINPFTGMFFLHHKDSTSGMDANNTIHDDFTVAHLIILGEMYCSPIQLDISITEEDQGKYDRNIMGVDGLGCQMDG